MSELINSAGEKGAHIKAVEMDTEPLGNGNGIPFSEFVVVSDSKSDPMELPTAQDNSLSMATLQGAYPGATGMKYKNPKTGALRAVEVDSSGTKLLPPLDGWDDKVFMVITSNTRAERGLEISCL
ncbi:unnamed protein product [Haemonchus placei]|uniref:TDP43_N domain-containing protein n=1 Tax=Haemonchus placei TaxID=6290 RepID=A0A0N4X154_HAEPC|nr:unnamed protein product [Haemonchus placei]